MNPYIFFPIIEVTASTKQAFPPSAQCRKRFFFFKRNICGTAPHPMLPTVGAFPPMTRPNRPPPPARAPEAPARAHPTLRTAPSAPSETYLGRPWSPPPRPAPAADALPRPVQMPRFPREATTMSSPSRSPDPKLARGPEVASPAARKAPSPPKLPKVAPASPIKHPPGSP